MSNLNELVSVIIPVYNTEKYIINCIKSVEKQSYKNIEIIVINDGSTDSSGDKVKELQKVYDNITYIFLEKNKGLSAVRNIGIKNANGKWIMFLDSDDTYNPDAVKILVKLIEKNGQLGMSNFSRKIGDKIITQDLVIKEGIYKKEDIAKLLYTNLPLNWVSCIGTKIYNLELIRKNKILFDDKKYKYNEDIAFVLDYFQHINSVGISNLSTYCYLMRPGSIQHSRRINPVDTITNARKKIRFFLEDSNLFDTKKFEYGNSLFEVYFGILLQDWEDRKSFYKLYDKVVNNSEYYFCKHYFKATNKKYLNILHFLITKNYTLSLYMFLAFIKFILKVRNRIQL